jgi:hypothetical protein
MAPALAGLRLVGSAPSSKEGTMSTHPYTPTGHTSDWVEAALYGVILFSAVAIIATIVTLMILL